MLKYVLTVFYLLNVFCSAQKLNVDVLFESLCPDSLNFIQSQLHPAWKDLSPYLNIKLVPFGKSASLENATEFVCQHGPEECIGNRIMSCALDYLEDQTAQVEYVNCFMKKYRKLRGEHNDVAQQCAGKVNLDFSSVQTCYDSSKGTQLQLLAEKDTIKIAPKFVPTILFNGEFRQNLQDISLVNFRELVCELIKQTYPNSCKTMTTLHL